jgi:hypothetical protein
VNGMKVASLVTDDEVNHAFYHSGTGSRVQKGKHVNPATRQFIAWDGEGVSPEKNKPQNYVLFGASTGERITSEKLTTEECLELIIEIGKKYPQAWHIAFAFDYDVNMILRSIGKARFQRLRNSDRNNVRFGRYLLQHIPGKWFRVTQYSEDYDHEKKKGESFTVTINDLFGFFQMSFVKAVRKWIAPDHNLLENFAEVEIGKIHRPDFTYAEIASITSYWETEIVVLQLLAESLRDRLYSVNLRITQWHGPGALASFTYNGNKIADHKAVTSDAIYDASRYAYAGGRFEIFKLGRFIGPVWGLDINSAYPYAIANLPSLQNGRWEWVSEFDPKAYFALWRVRRYKNDAFFGMRDFHTPGPVFFRDPRGAVSFPWNVDGWYWSPEMQAFYERGFDDFECLGGWVFKDDGTRPFAFVKDMYDARRVMKEAGNGAEKALKLALNSLYGKMAQRAGWKATHSAPTWHQLEWAGWVTSVCRAMIYSMMWRLKLTQIIGVETDGIYTTRNPADVGISNSGELGAWEVTQYDEIMYLQSGMYAKRIGDTWECKYRGLDSDTLSVDAIGSYMQELGPLSKGESWPTFSRGTTTRFIGYPSALKSTAPFHFNHAVWRTQTPIINPAQSGKRSHAARLCKACEKGLSAYEMPHNLVISSIGTTRMHPLPDGKPMSNRHDIPWLDTNTSEWRDTEEISRGEYSRG